MKKTILLTFVLALFLVGFVAATPLFDAATPSVVTGTIYDKAHNTVADANVSITCNSIVKTTTSLSDGSYSVEFLANDCGFNTPVIAHAQKDGAEGTATNSTCDGKECFIPVAIVDVTIPEFGLLGAMVIVIAGLGIIAYKRN